MKHILTFLLFVIVRQAAAQLPDYYVYLVTGDAVLQKPGSAATVTIKQKDLVFKKDKIIIKKGASVTLVDKDASFLVLNAPGTFAADKLAGKVNKKANDGITVKYLKLLYHELVDPSHDFEKFKKSNVAGVAGGVSRGDEDCGNRIFPINGLKTSAASVIFKWHRTSPSSDYSFFIYDGNGNDLIKMNTKDTLLTVNINETLQGKPGKYFWRVISKDGTCEDEIPIYFDLLTPENEKKQAEQIAVPGNDNMETQLQQIDKLEKNGFINVASGKYSALVKMNPDNKALQKSYVLFLLKYGLDEEARSAWTQ